MERICKHCNQTFNLEGLNKGWMANHSRWCLENPKRKDYVVQLEKNRSNIDSNSIELMKDGIKRAWEKGSYNNVDFGASFRGKTHTIESRERMSIGSSASNHRRLRKGTILYKDILLDSSWELALAIRLDELNIKWSRPEPIKWIDIDGKERNYFPDFYLDDYNLYLDPKNTQAFKVQKKKIDILNQTYKNIIWILSLDDCKHFSIDSYN